MKTTGMTRRVFLTRTGLVLAGGCLAGRVPLALADDPEQAIDPIARLGLITDIHYADTATRGSRHYRDSLLKMRAAVHGLNRLGIDAAVELGDLIDSADNLQGEIGHLQRIETEYAKLQAPRHYVFGNHCVHTLTKDEFIEHSGMVEPHTSFDINGVRFITLDACFNSDGEPYQRGNFVWTDANLPQDQLDWFEDRLSSAEGPAVVLTHQRIDGLEELHNVKNGAKARQIMEAAGNVLMVLSGHSHQNMHRQVNGIDYVVVRAMVEGAGQENNSFGRLLIFGDHSIAIEGHAKQEQVLVGRLGGIPGDTDGDGDIDDFDMINATQHYTGSLTAGSGGKGFQHGDTDGDGDVDDFDLIEMISRYTGSLPVL